MPRLRFTILDVLWLTLVVGLYLGWWLDRERRMEQQAETTLNLRHSLDELNQRHELELGEERFNTFQTRLREETWNHTALLLAKAMREDGWAVTVRADGYFSAANYRHKPEKAEKLNQENPLPAPLR